VDAYNPTSIWESGRKGSLVRALATILAAGPGSQSRSRPSERKNLEVCSRGSDPGRTLVLALPLGSKVGKQ
jgi:hypothetical protein